MKIQGHDGSSCQNDSYQLHDKLAEFATMCHSGGMKIVTLIGCIVLVLIVHGLFEHGFLL
jgi:hypothetical protein